MTQNTFGEHAWARAEVASAEPPSQMLFVGIGSDLVKQSGFSNREVLSLLKPETPRLIDGGAIKLRLNNLDVYARRRANAIDIGTRLDFDEPGWSILCDTLDAGEA